MSKLRRYYSDGNIYFVTAVTANRQKILTLHIDKLLKSIDKYIIEMKFNLIAFVILPEHFHMVIDPKSNNLSDIMRNIKLSFSKQLRNANRTYSGIVWQRRFWDHQIRNQDDMNRHIDYIHYNPVKHGLVKDPFVWKQSSINQYLANGFYPRDWGIKEIDFSNTAFGE
jgi:putative transposase